MAQYADIVEIQAPASARAGELVSIGVVIKNLVDYGFYVSVTGVVDGIEIPFSPDNAVVDPGAAYIFSGSFTMPGNKVRVTANSWFWSGSEWVQDGEDYVDIALAAVPEPAISDFKIADYAKV